MVLSLSYIAKWRQISTVHHTLQHILPLIKDILFPVCLKPPFIKEIMATFAVILVWSVYDFKLRQLRHKLNKMVEAQNLDVIFPLVVCHNSSASPLSQATRQQNLQSNVYQDGNKARPVLLDKNLAF